MNDVLMISGTIAIAVIIWTVIQTIAWLMFLLYMGTYESIRKMMLFPLISFPVFAFVVGLVRLIADPASWLWGLIIAPVVTACVFGLSILGLYIAHRLLGFKSAHTSEPNNSP